MLPKHRGGVCFPPGIQGRLPRGQRAGKESHQPHRQENHINKGVESGSVGGNHRQQLMVLLEPEEGDGKRGEKRQRGWGVCGWEGK